MPKTMTALRMGLSPAQARANSKRHGQAAYDEALAAGRTEEQAQEANRAAYEAEMRWYES